MATKTECKVKIVKPEGEIVTVYKEGPLFVWQSPKGWTVGHFKSGHGACSNRTWTKKRDALAFAQKLLSYEKDGKKINWNVDYDDFFEINGMDYLKEAWSFINEN